MVAGQRMSSSCWSGAVVGAMAAERPKVTPVEKLCSGLWGLLQWWRRIHYCRYGILGQVHGGWVLAPAWSGMDLTVTGDGGRDRFRRWFPVSYMVGLSGVYSFNIILFFSV